MLPALEDALAYSLCIGAAYGLIRIFHHYGKASTRNTLNVPPPIDAEPRTHWKEVGWTAFAALLVSTFVSDLSHVLSQRETLFLTAAIVLGAGVKDGREAMRIDAHKRVELF